MCVEGDEKKSCISQVTARFGGVWKKNGVM
jgi:hypothetical protein